MEPTAGEAVTGPEKATVADTTLIAHPISDASIHANEPTVVNSTTPTTRVRSAILAAPSLQLTEAVLKSVYRSCVDTALKSMVGEIVNVSSYEDEISDEFQEYDYLVANDKIDLLTRQTMLVNIAAFALGAAAGIEAIVEEETAQRKKDNLPKRTIGEAAGEQAKKILSGPGSSQQQAKQHLSLGSTVTIDGFRYDVRRAPLTWDGVVFSGPHAPGGGPRVYTVREAVSNQFIVPAKAFGTVQTRILGMFRHKDIDYNIISPNASWCERTMAVLFVNPDIPNVEHRYGPEHAVSLKLVERAYASPAPAVGEHFKTSGAVYQIIQPNVTWNPVSSMVSLKKGCATIMHTITGAIAAGLIKWIKEIDPKDTV